MARTQAQHDTRPPRSGPRPSEGVEGELGRALAEDPVLPRPGAGRTWSRMERLARVASRDLSAGRLYEGHTDAVAILAEAGERAWPGRIYGVWAARSPRQPTTATPRGDGWQLSGTKSFCSGAGIIDRALITAEAPDGYRLFDVDLAAAGVVPVDGSWPAVGMQGSASLTVTFDRTPAAAPVGGPGFYTGRPGFWFGAAGVAACWYGGALGLVEALLAGLPEAPGEHVLAEVGRAVARVASMRRGLEAVAAAIDADPSDIAGRARFGALEVRETVHAACVEVLAHVASAGGARPLGHDPEQSRRVADLFVYLSQYHGGSDAAELGRLAVEAGVPWR